MLAPVTDSAARGETPPTSASWDAGLELPSPSPSSARPAALTRGATARIGRWLLLIAVVGLSVVPSALGPLNHDVAWYLYGSRRLMQGARLYVDIVDLNPPLVFFLGVPVEWLSLVTGVPELTVMAGVVAVMALVAVALALAVLRRSRGGVDGIAYALMAAWLVCVLLVPGFDFGQREHWLLLLLLPYCVSCLVAAEDGEGARPPTAVAIAIGLLAGLGFSLKPYFLGALAVLWAGVIVRRRSLRPLLTVEHGCMVAVGAAYALFMLAVTPEYVFAMVPLARAQYWAFSVSRLALLGSQDVQFAIAGPLVAAVGGAALAGHRRGGILARQTGLLSLAFMAAYLVQAKGWFYQMLPAKAFSIISAVVLVVAFVQGQYERRRAAVAAASTVPASPAAPPSPVFAFLARAVLAGVVVIPAVFFVILHLDYHFATIKMRLERKPATLLDLVRDRAAGRPFYMLSSSVSPAFPLVNLAGATWPYHYHHFWPLPAFYRSDTSEAPAAYRIPDAQPPIERAFFRTVVDDLTQTPPALLLVDRSRFKQGFGVARFDYVDYFSQDPAFRALLRRYRRVTHVGPFEAFERVP